MGKTILITGCSDNGLGASLAIAFHKAGYRVLASGRNLSRLGQVTAAGIETVKLDVTGDLTEAVAEVSKKLGGKLDILLNNAGGILSLPITDLELGAVRQLFELNTFSLITITQAFLPLLRAAPQGMLVNNTSSVAILPVPLQGAYNASKAAASMLTQNLRLELAPFGIKVVELRTAAVESSIFNNALAVEGSNKLPADSLYALARDVIDEKLTGQPFMKTAQDSTSWAEEVVSDLSKKNPPIFVWRGGQAGLIKWGSLLPTWMFDGTLINMTGLDVFASRLKAAGNTKQ